MPGEPSAHEGALNLSPGRPQTRFLSGVRCICCQQSAQIETRPLAPLGWRRKRGHDAPNTLAWGGCLTEISWALPAPTFLGLGQRGELKMQNKLAPFGHRKRRKRAGKETRTCRLRSRIHLRAKRARERSCSNISRKRRWAVPPRPRSTQRRRSISAALDSADYNNNKLLGAPPHMPRTTRTLSHQALMSWRSRRLDILSFAPRSSETDLGNLKLR